MRKRRKKKISFFGLLLIVLVILFELYGNEINNAFTSLFSNIDKNPKTEEVTKEVIPNIVDSSLKVYFIDVGQADSILIQNKDEYMLIDAGNNEDGKKLVTYLNSLGIKKFKYVVGTHPHEDHIGGLDDIINSFEVEKVYLPDAETTTRTFEDVLDAIENNNVDLYVPEIDETFSLGEAEFKVIYTGTTSNDLNDASIVLKMTFGSKSFLFMGDAPIKVEKEILNKDISADVLKTGHHGSRYSSSVKFLDKVNAKYAIISCGVNNTYKHPHDETITKLNERKIKIYRTDELGTIIITSNGKDLEISSKKTDTNG